MSNTDKTLNQLTADEIFAAIRQHEPLKDALLQIGFNNAYTLSQNIQKIIGLRLQERDDSCAELEYEKDQLQNKHDELETRCQDLENAVDDLQGILNTVRMQNVFKTEGTP